MSGAVAAAMAGMCSAPNRQIADAAVTEKRTRTLWYFIKTQVPESRCRSGGRTKPISGIAFGGTMRRARLLPLLRAAIILDHVMAAAVERHKVAPGKTAFHWMHRHPDFVARLQGLRIPAEIDKDSQ